MEASGKHLEASGGICKAFGRHLGKASGYLCMSYLINSIYFQLAMPIAIATGINIDIDIDIAINMDMDI